VETCKLLHSSLTRQHRDAISVSLTVEFTWTRWIRDNYYFFPVENLILNSCTMFIVTNFCLSVVLIVHMELCYCSGCKFVFFCLFFLLMSVVVMNKATYYVRIESFATPVYYVGEVLTDENYVVGCYVIFAGPSVSSWHTRSVQCII